jgi:hypothetical protein
LKNKIQLRKTIKNYGMKKHATQGFLRQTMEDEKEFAEFVEMTTINNVTDWTMLVSFFSMMQLIK